jgi:hypothetical protein
MILTSTRFLLRLLNSPEKICSHFIHSLIIIGSASHSQVPARNHKFDRPRTIPGSAASAAGRLAVRGGVGNPGQEHLGHLPGDIVNGLVQGGQGRLGVLGILHPVKTGHGQVFPDGKVRLVGGG